MAHTAWYTSRKDKQSCLDQFGLSEYINAEADDEAYEEAFGAEEDDAAFHAGFIKPNTDATLKQAEKDMEVRVKAEAPPPKEVWSRAGFANMHKVWDKETADEAERTMQSSMQIPSSVVIPHVATGSAPKPRKRRGANKESDGAAKKKAKKD